MMAFITLDKYRHPYNNAYGSFSSPTHPRLRLVMAGIAFQHMSHALVPEVLIDKVARQVHEANYAPVLKEAMDAVSSPFERELLAGKELADFLADGTVSQVYVDDYYDWLTVILTLRSPPGGPQRFIAYHTYRASQFWEVFILEGTVVDGGIQLERFYMANRDGVYTRQRDYLAASPFRNAVPFNFLCEVFHLPKDAPMVQHGRRTWKYDELMSYWFGEQERAFLDIAISRYENMEI